MNFSPEFDPSKRTAFASLGDASRRIAQAYFDEPETTPQASLLSRIANSPWTRRGAVIGLAVALGATDYLLTHPEILDLLIHHPDGDVLSEGAGLLETVTHQPSEEILRGGIINRGKKIDLEKARQQLIQNTNGRKDKLRVRAITIGDSNIYTEGTMHDGENGQMADPKDQPHSFVQVAGGMVEEHLDDVGVSSLETATFAVPGAPSGDGYPQEKRKYGILSTEQFYRKECQDLLRKGLGSEKERVEEEDVLNVLTISATGDDWRLLMENALAFASFFSKLDNIKKATKSDIAEFKALLAESDQIGIAYGTHIASVLTQIAEINRMRHDKGLLDIKVVIAHPVSMHGVDQIPFRTLAQDDDTLKGFSDILVKVNPDNPNDDRHYINVEKVLYGHDIAYLLTVAIYSQLSAWVGTLTSIYPEELLDIIPLEWMGLEQIAHFFFKDGHPSADGTILQSALWLNLFQAISKQVGDVATLDKIARVSPAAAQAVEAVTQAKAA